MALHHDKAFFADVVHGVLKHQIEIDRSIARTLAPDGRSRASIQFCARCCVRCL